MFRSRRFLAVEPGAIQIGEPWARESPPTTTNGAIYMILVNIGRDTDRLLSTSSEAAETIELHAHRMEKMS